MPRAARIDIPNLLQHVIVRGIEKRKIFTDDDDRRHRGVDIARQLRLTGPAVSIACRREAIGRYPALLEIVEERSF